MMKYLYLLIVIFLFAGCGQAPPAASPTEAYRQFHAAVQRQDVSAMKRTFSKQTLEGIESFSKTLKKTSDETLKEIIKSYKEHSLDPPEIKDEKIAGDKATLQVKGAQGKWGTYNFVKEDDGWKISIDGVDKL